jgi:cytochrome oxidase Cu insertion factor (SCO1/SenC/PrrC family)
MKSELKEYREQLDRFNRWEDKQNRKKSEEEKLRQFFILFDLNRQLSESVIKKAHQAHLQHLIDIQRFLKRM